MDFNLATKAGARITQKEIVIKMYPSEIHAYQPKGTNRVIACESVKPSSKQVLFKRSQEFYATLNCFPISFLSTLPTPRCWGSMTKKEQLIYIRYRYARHRWRWYMRTEEGHKPNRNAAKPWGIIRDDAYDYLKSNPLIREVL